MNRARYIKTVEDLHSIAVDNQLMGTIEGTPEHVGSDNPGILNRYTIARESLKYLRDKALMSKPYDFELVQELGTFTRLRKLIVYGEDDAF